ncbi:MAG: beta-galactosidase [Paracoccaceae bacterium]|nr:beta-galactosidase [Paracoccaceae bacterium]
MNRALGVCYYPEQWDKSYWSRDAADMVELGISWVRINEFAWSKIEPQSGELRFEWLDEIIEILGKQNLKIILGTPTATPPRWMIDKYPDMLICDKEGNKRIHGSRRHYCFSHRGYSEECDRIVELLARRYGRNANVLAWQTDNEYGCHDTTISYSAAAKVEFQNWLRQIYSANTANNDGDIEALNKAWGNVFWSMNYSCFSEIDLPHNTVTEANPSHSLAFRKFSSEQVIKFNKRQVDIIRKFSGAPITHNFMGRITYFDHFKVGKDLDFASWDSYPLGFLEDRIEADEEFKKQFSRQGDPDFQAFHHDLYRSVGNGRFWVMEQQPGPVNWAPYNPNPLDGMVKLWSWEAFAHGAETVSFFRWRQYPYGQEQMHTGLHLPNGTKSAAYYEVKKLNEELKNFSLIETCNSKVAIIFDYDADAAWDIQPHGNNLSYFTLIFETYKALRKLGQSIDIVSSCHNNFSTYKIVFVPGLMYMDEKLKTVLSKFSGQVFLGPRTSTRDKNLNTPIPLPPNLPNFDAKIVLTESFRSDSPIALENGGHFCNYRERLEGSANIVERTVSGEPAILRGGNFTYIAGWLDSVALKRIFLSALKSVNLEVFDLPSGVRLRVNSKERFWFNYSSQAQKSSIVNLQPAEVFIEPIDGS